MIYHFTLNCIIIKFGKHPTARQGSLDYPSALRLVTHIAIVFTVE